MSLLATFTLHDFFDLKLLMERMFEKQMKLNQALSHHSVLLCDSSGKFSNKACFYSHDLSWNLCSMKMLVIYNCLLLSYTCLNRSVPF